MKIRLVRDNDYAEIARLRRQTIRNVNSRDYPLEIIQGWSTRVGVKNFRESAEQCKRWVALDKDKIVGFSEHSFECEISRIYVHKDFLRKGVGSKLLKAAEASLKKQGCKDSRIESTITAKDFYERNGYKVTRKSVSKLDGATVYKMIKRL